jgi:hypothetical protein
MIQIQNPLTGWPASKKSGFNNVGYPNFADPTLAAADPSSIANLVGWFKASDFDNTAHGTEVAQWADHSPTNRGATAIASAGSRMTVSRNALNGNMTAIGGTALRGFTTNSGGAPANSGLTTIATYTLFGVISFSSLNAASENNWFGITNNGLIIRFGINNTGPGDINLVYPNVGNFRTTTAVTVSAFHYIVLESSANTETVYVDGTALTWNSQPGTPSGDDVRVWSPLDDGNTAPFRGLCAECGIYNAAIGSTARTTLYNYFRQRYGLA